ncbi:MAG: GatB/YqeY domain-containing protein [Deltaproteobacteria bacterium]|nr:GatB/YqeY domain-containing protein [Deltaproteobacteria bacterium]MBW1928948.1 GatB/YqeY domain-containing protein [Deltaproteobacteria bacterium]MBW2024491.1 GatB/YqeY domain-containing protein [Deltaproteobacteria bacterium]MBW2125130.1 GatB/YqeY domain-containing protein [Deltaproteobacteria bacterium]RLB21960.1 MAG: GatB/YqeY domain-containing protein [Deltaproteobacteria bacterium]
MSLAERIVQDLKEAMRAKDETRVSCLRMLKTSIKNKQVEKGRELKDDEIQAVISSLVRKGKEAVAEFTKGGREDLAKKEEQELKIFYQYLPEQLSAEEIESVLRTIISELSATSPKDMGKVMKAAMSKLAGRAEGKQVSEIAKRLLSG